MPDEHLRPGCLYRRLANPGLLQNDNQRFEICVYPLLFGTARLTIGRKDIECGGYDDFWDYDEPSRAIDEAKRWSGQGEPTGWMRHPPTGRRRPHGDPAQQYIRM